MNNFHTYFDKFDIIFVLVIIIICGIGIYFVNPYKNKKIIEDLEKEISTMKQLAIQNNCANYNPNTDKFIWKEK